MRTAIPETTRILDDIRRIVRVLRESSRASQRNLRVTGAQLFALKALAHAPTLSLNELAARTRTHQSTVSVVAMRLVRAKLVKRMTSKQDARRIELAVTAKGHALLAQAPPAVQERLIDAIQSLPAKDRERLAVSLHQLIVAMHLDDEPPALFFEEDEPSSGRKEQK